MLRFKGLQAEEDAYLAGVVRRGDSPRMRELAGEVAGLRGRLAMLFHAGGKPEEVVALVRQAAQAQALLGDRDGEAGGIAPTSS